MEKFKNLQKLTERQLTQTMIILIDRYLNGGRTGNETIESLNTPACLIDFGRLLNNCDRMLDFASDNNVYILLFID